MKMFLKRSFWAMLTVYLALWLVIAMVAGVILEDYKNVINGSLGLTGYRTETIDTGVEEDLEYFKSKYVQYDADGNILYVTDENGYTHQVYDDVALRQAAIEKAYQVQREGSTILWNNADNGLPLAQGNKVSLFSHSSVAWVHSGFGSGRANTSGSNDMKKALTNAGLSVNDTLWNFYKSGAGKDYVRDGRYLINEVPWSKYTDAVKNSFASFGDAAIIVLSRETGENASSGDAALSGVDTPSGSYYDLSKEELDMIRNVVELKKAGTFKKVIVLLNTATDIWFAPIFEFKDDIDCCLWVSQTGQVGLDEVGNILAGKSIPSGHLADTFLMNCNSNPVTVNFTPLIYTNANTIGIANAQWQSTYTIYTEGIYLGYKYYETRYEDAVMGQGNASSTAGAVNSAAGWKYSEEVAFPFGYGAAYTEFQYSGFSVELQEDGNYNVTVTVTNIGDEDGQDAVQIYVQKPYTDYDRQHKVEQAAVNLAGYAKTPELQPGESVTVSIIVRDDALKTYDANNAKTYIREAGDYYFVAGHDAHDAINNILAAKGYTPDNTDGVMDAAGNTKMVHKITFADDDFTTYSVSEQTGYPITNQFDNTDWNKYHLNTGETITYLSRNDWEATYPVQYKLSLSKEMLEELGWNKDVAINPNDKMPLYGQARTFNLIDLKGLPYDHPSWDALLNQMTLEEQIKLLAHCYHGTKEVISVAKPADITHDGPLGIRQKYKTNSSAYTMSYPNTVLLAASFNDQLAYEVGYLMGEDMLHVGVTGLYGPGSNIHRSTYSGRNYEYYSEDGFLSGMMGKWQVIGIQETGCYVNMKHFALNDAESNRHGVGTWANEQSIREIYLQAYEYAVTEGACTGIMSAFNRLGTLWCGAHKGLTTEVLRNEWGFQGFVISDCSWREYMGVVDGVMAGNDCILDDATEDAYYAAENNPTIAQGIRTSVHNILYVVANGNAMNGFSSNTRIYEVDEWWQVLVKDVQKGIAIATAISFVITLIAFIFLRDLASNISTPSVLKIVETVIALVVALAIGAGAVFVTVTLPGLPNNFMAEFLGSDENNGGETGGNGGEEQAPSLKDQLEGDLVDYIFEVECSENNLTSSNIGNESNIVATNHPSGGQYAHNLTKLNGEKFTFKITSASAQKAVLSICMGQRDYAMKLKDMFNITVNGVAVEVSEKIEFSVYGGIKYFDWTEKEVAIVDLVEGENVIELTMADHGGKFLNFDYIALTSAANLQWTKEVGVGHTFGAWEMTNKPTLDAAGELYRYCNTCRLSDVFELPAISEANGYTKNVISEAVGASFGSASWTYTKDGQTFAFNTVLYPEGVKAYQFEADKAKLTTQATDGAHRVMEVISGATDSVYIGYVNNTEWTLKIQIASDIDCEALFVLRMSRHNSTSYKFNNGRTLTVNGEKVAVSDDLVIDATIAATAYYNWDDIEIAVINLKAGKNVIELSNAAKPFNNIDYFELRSVGELGWYVVGDDHVHTEGLLAGTPATCLTGGTSDVKYCTDCDEILADQDTIPALGHNIEGGACTRCQAVLIEAESGEIVNLEVVPDKYKNKLIGDEGKGAEATNYPSGGAFVYNFQHCAGVTIRYEVTSSEAQKAQMTFRLGRRQYESTVSEWLVMTVNGKTVAFDANAVFSVDTGLRYYDWIEQVVATVDLQEGYNVIEFTALGGDRSLNFDYFTLNAQGSGVISACCAENAHTYSAWEVDTYPTYDAIGLISYDCTKCGKPMRVELPKVSAANGYTLITDGVKATWSYTYKGETFQFIVNHGIVIDVTETEDVFTSVVDNNGPNGNGVETNKNKNNFGVFYELTQGATFTLEVNASKAANAILVLKICIAGGTYNTQEIITSAAVTAGGQTVNGTILDNQVSYEALADNGRWYDYNGVTVELADIQLKAGKNTITFTMGNLNVNIVGVEVITEADLTHETVKRLYGDRVVDFDPFAAANGGSTSGSTFKSTEAKYGTFYKKTQNSTFTITVNVDKATDVVLYLNLAFNNTSGYSLSSAITSVSSKNAAGQANAVVRNEGTIKNNSWTTNSSKRFEIATISLSAGENTITFTMGNNDINIASLYILSDEKLTFGKKAN